MSRAKAITPESYSQAVRKLNSISDMIVGRELGKPRMTVYRFRMKEENTELIEELNIYLKSLENVNLSPTLMFFENFNRIGMIQQYLEKLNTREVSKAGKKGHIRNLFTICKYLKVHPRNLNVIDYAKVLVTSRDMKARGETPIRGLYFSNQRHTLRSWFTLMHNMSGEHITGLGIHAENTEGLGKDADKRVAPEVRIRLEELIMSEVEDKEYALELLGSCVFMYATATRRTSCYTMRVNDKFKNVSLQHTFKKDVWRIQTIDKGVKGGLLWNKYIRGSLLEKFSKIMAERHNLNFNNIDAEIATKVDYFFPILRGRGKIASALIKKLLIKSGIPYKEFKPIHIWRNTFAQEFLKATDYNYEACAELGGWLNTLVLKRSYGKMPESAKINVLARAMGEPVDEVIYALDWRGEKIIESNADLINILRGADRETLMQAVAMIQGGA